MRGAVRKALTPLAHCGTSLGFFERARMRGTSMPKEEWGTKRVCPTTGKRFYDMNRNPIVSPYTGEVVNLDTGKGSRMMVADKADKESEKENEDELIDDEDVVLEDDEESSDMDLGDDVLEEEDDDNVSLDEIADVAGDDDE